VISEILYNIIKFLEILNNQSGNIRKIPPRLGRDIVIKTLSTIVDPIYKIININLKPYGINIPLLDKLSEQLKRR
jgi:hypothetical protein